MYAYLVQQDTCRNNFLNSGSQAFRYIVYNSPLLYYLFLLSGYVSQRVKEIKLRGNARASISISGSQVFVVKTVSEIRQHALLLAFRRVTPDHFAASRLCKLLG